MKHSGFTLIELLIVVAIIAILAAIAVPNFLEAQTRAKVSRVKADMRSATTALEAYRIDWNIYPYCGYDYTTGAAAHDYNYWYLPIDLSTPQAYVTSVNFVDPFRQTHNTGSHWQYRDIRYVNTEATWGTVYDPIEDNNSLSSFHADVMEEWGGWYLDSAGPDRYYGPNVGSSATLFPNAESWPGVSDYTHCNQPYDPTNGTISWGDIMRSQLDPDNGYKNAG